MVVAKVVSGKYAKYISGITVVGHIDKKDNFIPLFPLSSLDNKTLAEGFIKYLKDSKDSKIIKIKKKDYVINEDYKIRDKE